MPKYVIEREIPGIGNVSAQEPAGIAQQSCSVLTAMGPQIQWLHSYVVENKTYCIYIAPSEAEIRQQRRLPAFLPTASARSRGSLIRLQRKAEFRRHLPGKDRKAGISTSGRPDVDIPAFL